jgi:hypothetical protein
MGLFNTLEELQKANDKEGTGTRRQFFSLKAGEQFKIRFRQELTRDANNYDEENGQALVVAVHVSPFDFKKKLACTIEDEEYGFRCWAHEQVAADKRWREKKHVLLNVAVMENNEWVNKILDQTFSPKHVIQSLIEYASEYGSIVDRDFKINRIGSGMNDTNYNLIPLDPKPASDEVNSLEIFDLEGTYRKLPYDEQQEYFLADEQSGDSSTKW